MKNYKCKIKEDKKGFYIIFPKSFIREYKWKEGDTLEIDLKEFITKKKISIENQSIRFR